MAPKETKDTLQDAFMAAAKAKKSTKEWRDGLAEAQRDEQKAREALRKLAGPEGIEILADLLGVVKPPKAGAAPKHARKPRKDFGRRKRIIKLMEARGGFLSLDEIRVAENCSVGAAGGAIRALQKAGEVTAVARGRYALKDKVPANGAT